MTKTIKLLEESIGWGALEPHRQPEFDGFDTRSVYVPMPDGVRLAVEVHLPRGLEPGRSLPTLLFRTRYWREVEVVEGEPPVNPFVAFFTSYGYAIVRADVRGTGASFGTMRHEWQPEDTEDAYHLVDWIISQPWSNGKVGAYGISYPGTTAELLAETCHPAAKAIWATYFELDGYTDLALPGGVPCLFIEAWGQHTALLDQNVRLGHDSQPDPRFVGVKPVDEDKDRTLLKAAVAEHKDNVNAHILLGDVVYKDQTMTGTNVAVSQMAVYSRREKIERSGVPIDIWGSWMDANTPDTVIRHFTSFNNTGRAVINAWSHGGSQFCSPFKPAGSDLELSLENQLSEILRFMDAHFMDADTGIPEKTLYYYTMGEEKWKSTHVWPPQGCAMQRWYLKPGRGLSREMPDEQAASETYRVDYSATTGERNRWWTEMGGGPVVYDDRAEQDRKLLVFESEPLEEDMEITGYPVFNLQAASTHTDGAFFVYLEDVAPDGRVTYLSEGILRALHRKVSDKQPPYKVFGPYHSYEREDAEPLTPGEIATLPITLIPTSVLVRKGHKLRLSLAGADASAFVRLPAEGDPVITVSCGAEQPSWIDLPVMPRA